MKMLENKSKTEFVLNVLIYADFSRWPQSTIKDLIEKINEITNETVVEQNRILLSYNPIQTICLACCHLSAIGKAISLFQHEGENLSNDL